MVWFDRDSVTPVTPISAKNTSPTGGASKEQLKKGLMARCIWSLDPRCKHSSNRGASVGADCANTLFHRVSNQIWNFVLPESGEHSFHVVAVGTPNQRVFLDDVELECRKGMTTFPGPGGAILQLKQIAEPLLVKKEDARWNVSRWALLVNDRMVEKVALSGNGLRDPRSLPDGEYTIAHAFDAVHGSQVQQ